MRNTVTIVLVLLTLENAKCTWLLSNKKHRFDPSERMNSGEVSKEEMIERAVYEMMTDEEYIRKQKLAEARQRLGPYNGANLTLLRELLHLKPDDDVGEALKAENLDKLDITTRIRVLNEIAPKEFDEEFRVIPRKSPTSVDPAEIERKFHEDQRKLLEIAHRFVEEEKLAKERGTIVEEEKELWCFYNAHTVAQRKYALDKDFPIQLCTSVVYCCLGVDEQERAPRYYDSRIDQDRDNGLHAFLTFAAKKKPDSLRHVAVGGPQTDYSALSSVIMYRRVHGFVENIYEWLNSNGIPQDVHLVWYIPEPHRLRIIADHEFFMRCLSKTTQPFRKERRVTLVVPVTVSDSSLHSYGVISDDLIALDGPEDLNDPTAAECPVSFGEYFEDYRNKNDKKFNLKPAIFNMLIAGFMLKGYGYNPADKPVIRMAGYEDICKAAKDRLIFKDDCTIMQEEARWAAALSPEVFRRWKRKDIRLKGFAVMDPEWDDFNDVCGQGKSPVITALRDALQSNSTSPN